MKLNKEELLKKYPEFAEVLMRQAYREYSSLGDNLHNITNKWENGDCCEQCGKVEYDDETYQEEYEDIEKEKSEILTIEWVDRIIKKEKDKLEDEKYYQLREIKRIEEIKNKLEESGNYNEQNEEIKRLTLLHENKKRRRGI